MQGKRVVTVEVRGKNIVIVAAARSRIRNEIKFESIDALKMQLDKDAKIAIEELTVL